MRYMPRLFTFCLLLFTLHTGLAYTPLPHRSQVPGGIAVIPLKEQTSVAPIVYFDNKRVMVLKNNSSKHPWVAVVGIPLTAKLGRHPIRVASQGKEIQGYFTVHDKEYLQEKLSVKNKRKVMPNAADKARIKEEKAKIKTYMHTWSDISPSTMRLEKPVSGRFSSPFGVRRTFNNHLKSRHTGLDIAAGTGTPIKAPLAGKVIGEGDFFYTGNTVFIDHGQGLVTFYCHMQKIDVKPGETVKKGTIIGTVGATGRVTGPHLHWGVVLNGTKVDPMLLLASYKAPKRKTQ